MRKFVKLLVCGVLLLTLGLSGCSNQGASDSGNTGNTEQNNPAPVELYISAAASLKDSMEKIQTLYAEEHPEVTLIFNFAGSGTLQQQIEQGAPADLFISAGKSQMNALVEKNLMVKDSIVNLLGNELVLVVGANNTEVASIQDLTKDSVVHIGIGTPESVPAGKYSQQALTSLNLWEELKDKYVMAKDVTQVLNYVETGNAEAGIVYKSDAQNSGKVKVVESFPAGSHDPIIYPAGIVAASKKHGAAAEFLAFLQSPAAQDIFAQYGFKAAQ